MPSEEKHLEEHLNREASASEEEHLYRASEERRRVSSDCLAGSGSCRGELRSHRHDLLTEERGGGEVALIETEGNGQLSPRRVHASQ